MNKLMLFCAGVMVVLFVSLPVRAADCGFPPAGQPPIPDGAKADREIINNAVKAVRDHSIIVNQHLNCLQSRRDELFINMTRDQQDRWIEDYNVVIDALEDLETSLNVEIRAFNAKESSKS